MMDSEFINMGVLCQMVFMNEITDFFSGEKPKYRYSPFLINTRSCISKTPFILANNVGVIDSAYRGNLIVALRCLDNNGGYNIEKYKRLTQVCHPSYCPIFVVLVDSDDIDMDTKRGAGGFGSTGG